MSQKQIFKKKIDLSNTVRMIKTEYFKLALAVVRSEDNYEAFKE